MRAPYDAILFDFDGVIVDSEPIHFQCWREVLAPLGIDFDWDYYHEHFIGVSDRRMAEELAGMVAPPVSVETIYGHYAEKTQLFRSRMRDHLPFAPGIVEFIQSSKGLGLGVVTSSRRSEVEPVLMAGGLLPFLSVAVYGDDVTNHKPDPEPYLKAAKTIGARRPLVVEDSLAGVASGKAAGFDVLRIPHPEDTTKLVRERLTEVRGTEVATPA